ncbi:MAG: hypothetical protein KDE53_06860 [Caldilineaceae bacterium]|nr:hypothetical protein [Caldilineaceae bacterium]
MVSVQLLVGTTAGLFIYRADATRQRWQVDGPLFDGWSVDCVWGDSRHGDRIFAGLSHPEQGPLLQLSTDGGATWMPLPHAPAYPPASGLTVRRIWQITPGAPSEPETYYAGVDEAGLFVSYDRGLTWQEMLGLNRHPARLHWRPSRGGLTLHAVIVDPTAPARLWVAIASAGIWRSEDGGTTWQACNQGLRAFTTPNGPSYLVHKLVQDPHDPRVLYLQNIDGVYCTTDGAETWQPLEEGLPSTFGFPFGVDHLGNRYVVPLDGETRGAINGEMTVYRRRATDQAWQPFGAGLPTDEPRIGVLRNALAVDSLATPGVYLGTTQGTLFYSLDCGEVWRQLPGQLARVTALQAWVTKSS